MGDSASLALHDRLARLERQNVLLKLVVTCLCIVFGGIVLMGAGDAKEKTIEAQVFILKDETGKTRGEFLLKDGSAGMRLMDTKGELRVQVSTSDEASGIVLFAEKEQRLALGVANDSSVIGLADKNGQQRLQLEVDKDPSFTLLDKKGKFRGQFGLAKGEPHLSLQNENEKALVAAGIENDIPLLGVQDPKTKRSIYMIAEEKLGSALQLRDEKGRWLQLRSTPDGDVLLELIDDDKMVRGKVSLGKEGAQIRIIDEKGNVVFSKP
jgi:hypothetical protein